MDDHVLMMERIDELAAELLSRCTHRERNES